MDCFLALEIKEVLGVVLGACAIFPFPDECTLLEY